MRLAGFEQALQNRRFRWLLLGVVAAAVAPAFLWNTAIAALLSPDARYDDFKVFQLAALRMREGVNPYLDFVRYAPEDLRHWDSYIYPPLLAWLLQPVASWSGVGRALLIVGAGFVCLGVAYAALVRVLRLRDRQALALMAVLFMAFFPVIDNFHWGQLNLLLLALTCLWCLAYVDGGRWWGAVALGLGVALKLLQAPLALAYVASRAWRELAISIGAALLFTLVAYQWVAEYAFVVFPAVGGGTGWMGNISPSGAFMRLADGASFMDRAFLPMPFAVRAGALLVAVAVLTVDWVITRGIESTRSRRLMEASVLVASLPLISPVTWDGHLVLQLLPLCVVGWIALPRRLFLPLALAVVAVLLMGPANAWYWSLATSGALSNSPWARPLAELPTLGVVLNWVAVVSAAPGLATAPIRVESRLRPASSVG